MYENNTFMEYVDLTFQGFRNNIQLNVANGDSIELAQCRMLATLAEIYTNAESFNIMSDIELRHYSRISLPENVELLEKEFHKIVTEPHALGMVDTIIRIIGNQHQYSLDLAMHRHTMKKLEEVNKEIQALADELGIQLPQV